MNIRQLGTRLANAIDRKIAAAVEASSLATGLVANGDGTVVVNTALASGTTPEDLGKALAESIYACKAAMLENDVDDVPSCAISPTWYGYLPQSLTVIDADYTSGNGGYDTGEIKMVGGVSVFASNNLPSTAALVGLVFTSEAAGMAKLWDIQIDINEQPEFLNAKLINAYFSNGIKALRCQCACSIKSA
jgi:hypothetical protein